MSVVLAAAFVAALTPYLQTIPDDLTIAPAVLAAYLGTLVVYHLARAGRWVVLVRGLGPVGTWDAMRVGFAGSMWIALLPMRLGEFARPLFLAQRSSVRVSAALGAVAVERVVDGFVVCGLFFFAAASVASSGPLYTGALVVVGLFAVALVGLVILGRWPTVARTMLQLLPGRIEARVGPAVGGLIEGVGTGLAAVSRVRVLAPFVATTVVYWGANAVGMWVLMQGTGLDLPLSAAAAVMAVMNVVLMIPGGPAQLGVFQTGVAAGLALYLPAHVVHGPGSTFAFYLYVCQLATIVVVGLSAQMSLRLDWRAVLGLRSRSADEAEA